MDKRLKKLVDDSNNIVFFGGAGVSTESGIPDFRSENGVFQAIKKYGNSPEYLLSYSYLFSHPEKFFEYYKENLVNTSVSPNDAHRAIAYLEKIGKLKACITQNVDGLHQLAGSKTVYELHGSLNKNYCVDCKKSYDLDYILDPKNCEGVVPKCESCNGIVRPDVTLYGEALDQYSWQSSVDAVKDCDMLIIGGTSLVVYPAASLLNYFKGRNLVLINKDSTKYDNYVDLHIMDSIGKVMKIEEVFD